MTPTLRSSSANALVASTTSPSDSSPSSVDGSSSSTSADEFLLDRQDGQAPLDFALLLAAMMAPVVPLQNPEASPSTLGEEVSSSAPEASASVGADTPAEISAAPLLWMPRTGAITSTAVSAPLSPPAPDRSDAMSSAVMTGSSSTPAVDVASSLHALVDRQPPAPESASERASVGAATGALGNSPERVSVAEVLVAVPRGLIAFDRPMSLRLTPATSENPSGAPAEAPVVESTNRYVHVPTNVPTNVPAGVPSDELANLPVNVLETSAVTSMPAVSVVTETVAHSGDGAEMATTASMAVAAARSFSQRVASTEDGRPEAEGTAFDALADSSSTDSADLANVQPRIHGGDLGGSSAPSPVRVATESHARAVGPAVTAEPDDTTRSIDDGGSAPLTGPIAMRTDGPSIDRPVSLDASSPVVVQGVRPDEASGHVVRAAQMVKGADGVQHMRLEMHPKDLGAVAVEVTIEGGLVHVDMVAERSETKDLLRSSLSELRSSLAAVGLSAGRVEVETQLADSRSGQSNPRQDMMGQSFTSSDSRRDPAAAFAGSFHQSSGRREDSPRPGSYESAGVSNAGTRSLSDANSVSASTNGALRARDRLDVQL